MPEQDQSTILLTDIVGRLGRIETKQDAFREDFGKSLSHTDQNVAALQQQMASKAESAAMDAIDGRLHCVEMEVEGHKLSPKERLQIVAGTSGWVALLVMVINYIVEWFKSHLGIAPHVH